MMYKKQYQQNKPASGTGRGWWWYHQPESLKVFSGDILRIDISGNKANNTEIMSPSPMPCQIAIHEIFTDMVIGKKSFKT
jgi:hypothetical protein